MKPISSYSLPMICAIAIGLTLTPGLTSRSFAEDAAQPAEVETHVTHVDATAAAKLVDANQVKVIDVRTPEEFQEGHIKDAVNVDFHSKDFAEQLGKLDKNQPYLVHCAAGGRSTAALPTFEKLGFTKIYHLDHGLKAWKKAGNAVTK